MIEWRQVSESLQCLMSEPFGCDGTDLSARRERMLI